MKIPADIPSLWYENEKGEKWFPKMDGDLDDMTPPKGFIFQHSRSVSEMRHEVLRMVVQEEVEKCDHPLGYVIPTYGWIDGIVGRECRLCKGTQVRKVGEPWPEKWEANGSRPFFGGGSTYPNDLTTAMVRSNQFDVHRATLICAMSCERCLNVLYHEYMGDGHGYAEGSEEWNKCGTSCEFCEGSEDEVAVDGVVNDLLVEQVAAKFPSLGGGSLPMVFREVLKVLGWEYDQIMKVWDSPEKRHVGRAGQTQPVQRIGEGIISNHGKEPGRLDDFLRKNDLGRVADLTKAVWERMNSSEPFIPGE